MRAIVSGPSLRIANGLAGLVLVAWMAYAALGTNVFGKSRWPQAGTMVDYRLFYTYSRAIVQSKVYPAYHLYPPPAIVLHYALAVLPYPVSTALYLAGTIAAAVGCWWLLIRMLGLERRPAGFILSLLALGVSAHYFSWDLRSQNCNGILLFTCLLGVRCLVGERPRAAGFWLAFSVSLKLFSLFLIPYILWRGHRRAFAWSLAFLAVFWLLLPALVFGCAGTIEVYGSWLDQVRFVSGTRLDLVHPIVISLQSSAEWLARGQGLSRDLIVNGLRVAWLCLIVLFAVATWRPAQKARNTFPVLADISLLILAPIAVSPYLEPYHPVAIAIPAMLLLHAASDPCQSGRVRRLALACFLVVGLLTALPAPWALHGLLINLRLLAATGAALAVARLRQPDGIESLAGRRIQHLRRADGTQPITITARFEVATATPSTRHADPEPANLI